MPETGPIYGVPLLDSLPMGKGGMTQQLPSRKDLESIQSKPNGTRVVAGYEVLLAHYRRATESCRFALEHVTELREAWRTGALHECDGMGGTRSNRNVDVESKLREAIGDTTPAHVPTGSSGEGGTDG